MGRLVKVAHLDELRPGQGKLVELDGQAIALFNVNAAFCALSAICPHEDGPLH